MKLSIYDGLRNFVAGLGDSRDKASYSEFYQTKLSPQYLGVLYRHWMFAKAVDIPADDMTVKWRKCFARNLDAEKFDDFYQAETDLNAISVFNEALKLSRLYGSSLIILDTADKSPIEQPLDPQRLGKGALKGITAVDCTDITPMHSFGDVMNSRKPLLYQLPDGTKIHPSRVIRFDGIKLPWPELQKNMFWGDSILHRIYDDVLNAKGISKSVASMVFEATLDVIGVRGLFDRLGNDAAKSALSERFSLSKLMQSVNRTKIIDLEDEQFNRISTSFSGLAEIHADAYAVVAAGADIPITRFLGRSATGLNATGEGDLRNYYDMIASKQVFDLASQIAQFDEVLTRHVYGSKPDGWGSEFNPLWSMSETDVAIRDKTDMETDTGLLDMGAIQLHMIAGRLFDLGRYPGMTAEFVEELRELDEMSAKEDYKNAQKTEDPIDPGTPGADAGVLPQSETAGQVDGDKDQPGNIAIDRSDNSDDSDR